jgi:AcrR family transcriptional regulator
MSSATGAPRGLRDRKRDRTRKALVDAAVELFERKGYEGTTIAEIAAAADIGTRTFFGYFASKEELLFPESDQRVDAALAAIANREPGDRPVDVLLRALRDVAAPEGQSDDMVNRLAALRLRLTRTVPAVRGRGLQIQLDAQRVIASHLREAFPDELDGVTAAALVGAFVGAVTGALQVLLDDPAATAEPDRLRRQLQHATELALGPWRDARAVSRIVTR